MHRKLVPIAAAIAGCLIIAPLNFAFPDPPTPQDAPPKQPEVKPLNIGDKAPPIDIEHWVKGEKVQKFEPGKVYVVEFWATWCGPCLQSMPHLTKVQEELKDYGVTIVGISDEPRETVVEFLAKKDKEGKLWNDKIGYRLTTDPDKSAKRDYLEAAAQNGIPTAFIVGKDGRVEWIGHPMGGMEKTLQEVIHDRWDRAAFKARFDKEQAAERNRMEFFRLLTQDKAEEGYALGRKLVEELSDNGSALNEIAWFVLTNPRVKTRDLDFAMEAAMQANELKKGQDPAILDTYARAYYEKGDLKNAVRLQRSAVHKADELKMPMAEDLAKVLKKYEEELATGKRAQE